MFIFYISATFFYRALRISQMSLLIPGNCASTTFFPSESKSDDLFFFILFAELTFRVKSGLRRHTRELNKPETLFFSKNFIS